MRMCLMCLLLLLPASIFAQTPLPTPTPTPNPQPRFAGTVFGPARIPEGFPAVPANAVADVAAIQRVEVLFYAEGFHTARHLQVRLSGMLQVGSQSLPGTCVMEAHLDPRNFDFRTRQPVPAVYQLRQDGSAVWYPNGLCFRITANHYLVLLPNRQLALWSPQDGLGTPLTSTN